MSLKKYMLLLLVLIFVLSLLPMAVAAADATEAEETLSPEEPEEKEFSIPWAVQAMLFAMIATFLQNKFIHGRKR